MENFGTRFGRLVKRYRGIEGLTQQQLAVRAFDIGEGSKSRISDLESGKIPNPHQKTVDALVVALSIPRSEVASCWETDTSLAVQNEFGLRRELLEVLALRFEHENPNAPDQELSSFLKAKAVEYVELKRRLDGVRLTNSSLVVRLGDARALLDDGRFDEADEVLCSAEDDHFANVTLKEIATQADIRATRADAMLLRGQIDDAANLYDSAASYFRAFDRDEEGFCRVDYCWRLLDSWRGDTDKRLKHARGFVDENIQSCTPGSPVWGLTHHLKGRILSWNVDSIRRGEGLRDVEASFGAFEIAVKCLEGNCHPSDWAHLNRDYSSALKGFAHLLFSREERTSATQHYQNSLACINRSLGYWSSDSNPYQWLLCVEDKARILAQLSLLAPESERLAYLQDALRSTDSALQRKDYQPNWTLWLNVLGLKSHLLERLSEVADPRKSRRYLLEAIACQGACLSLWGLEGDFHTRHFEAISQLKAKVESLRLKLAG
jgi:transcriptional regulator with XRE-family HTH domain